MDDLPRLPACLPACLPGSTLDITHAHYRRLSSSRASSGSMVRSRSRVPTPTHAPRAAHRQLRMMALEDRAARTGQPARPAHHPLTCQRERERVRTDTADARGRYALPRLGRRGPEDGFQCRRDAHAQDAYRGESQRHQCVPPSLTPPPPCPASRRAALRSTPPRPARAPPAPRPASLHSCSRALTRAMPSPEPGAACGHTSAKHTRGCDDSRRSPTGPRVR